MRIEKNEEGGKDRGNMPLSPHSNEGWEGVPSPMDQPEAKGVMEVINVSEEFVTEEEEFSTAPKIVIKYGDYEKEFEDELTLEQLLETAREWGIRRFVTEPPLTRGDFPIRESMTITLVPRDKAGY